MPSNKITLYFLSLVFVLLNYSAKSATCTATVSGNWENASTWSCGSVPTCSDNITIPSGYTVTITSVIDYSSGGGCSGRSMYININGVLQFQTGKKITFPNASEIHVNGSGNIQPGGGGGSSNLINFGSTVVWSAGAGAVYGPAVLNMEGLPIELVFFNGNLIEQNKVKLTWQTATEKNNAYFEVERSEDGSNFKAIGKTISKAKEGNSGSNLNYEMYDLTPLSELSYYRLKQVDFDNTASYSSIISIDNAINSNILFNVYPNPNNGSFKLDLKGIKSNLSVDIIIIDNLGKEVYNSTTNLESIQNNSFNMESKGHINQGIYTIQLLIEGVKYNSKLIVN